VLPRRLKSQQTGAAPELEALRRLIDLEAPTHAYTRELKKPIVRTSKLNLKLSGSPRERTAHEDDLRIVSEQFEKLFLLLDHFGISRTNRLRWFHLAFQLARRHVPGAQVVAVRRKRGKPRRGPSNLELVWAVDVIKYERKLKYGGRLGVRDAISILQSREPTLWGGRSADDLRNRYYEFSRGLPKKALPLDRLIALFGRV